MKNFLTSLALGALLAVGLSGCALSPGSNPNSTALSHPGQDDFTHRLMRDAMRPEAQLGVKAKASSKAFKLSAPTGTYLSVSNPPGGLMLAWDPSPSPAVTNYNVYEGTASGDYTNETAAGLVTNYTVTGLARGVTYYYAITAQGAGLESPFSNEVNGTPPAPPLPPTALPIVTLVVENTPTLSPTNWSMVGSIQLSATNVSGFYRSSLVVSQPAPAVQTFTPQAQVVAKPLPPFPK